MAAICTQPCVNGGVCTAPDTCDCTAAVGYEGVDCSARKYDVFQRYKYYIRHTHSTNLLCIPYTQAVGELYE